MKRLHKDFNEKTDENLTDLQNPSKKSHNNHINQIRPMQNLRIRDQSIFSSDQPFKVPYHLNQMPFNLCQQVRQFHQIEIQVSLPAELYMKKETNESGEVQQSKVRYKSSQFSSQNMPLLQKISPPIASFLDMGFGNMTSSEVLRRDFGFKAPLTLQMQLLPLCLEERDVICKAKRGAGKTVSLILIAIQKACQIQARFQRNSTETRKRNIAIVYLGNQHNRDGIDFLYENIKQMSNKITEINQMKSLKIKKVSTNKDQGDINEKQNADILVCDLNQFVNLTKQDPNLCQNLALLAFDNCELVSEDQINKGDLQEIFDKIPQNCQKLLFGTCLPPKSLLAWFSKNGSETVTRQEADKLILIQNETWTDLSNNHLPEGCLVASSESDNQTFKPAETKVHLIEDESKREKKLVQLIQAQLEGRPNSSNLQKSTTFQRKPILVCCDSPESACNVYRFLKQKLVSVRKISKITSFQDFSRCQEYLLSESIIVLSDNLCDTALDLQHPFISLLINYDLPNSLQNLVKRFSYTRRGFEFQNHLQKFGRMEQKVHFLVQINSIKREQIEDLAIFMKRNKGRMPQEFDFIIKQSNQSVKECQACYTEGFHRNKDKFDCPQECLQQIWELNNQNKQEYE